MGKPYETPKLEEVKTPALPVVDKQNVDNNIKINGQVTEKVPQDITSIYLKRLELFKKFIEGEYASNNLEERAEAQHEFITFFNTVLGSQYNVMSDVLTAFIKMINENKGTFTDEKVLAPYWGMKTKPNAAVAQPYIVFIHFIIQLALNIQRKPQFGKGFDVPRFLAMWTPAQQQNLNRFIYD